MLMMGPGLALAAETVSARTGGHDGYSRLVFDWGQAVPYHVTRNGDRLDITFDRDAALDKSGAETGGDLNILGLEQTSSGDGKMHVAVTLAPGTDYRHFLVGSRVIVDVLDGKGKPAVKTPAAAPPPTAKAAETPAPAAAHNEGPAVPAKAVEEVKQEELPQKTPSAIEQAMPAVEPHVVTVSSTESVGMAAFERFGTLWVVIDRPGFTVPPQIAGPEKKLFKPFHRMDTKNATVFTTELPPDAAPHMYGEGGGLVWRVVMTPNERTAEPVTPERSFNSNDPARGGTIVWPFKQVTKLVELTDPAVGDTITVATVRDSGENTGPRRDFVDFTALQAPIGLAVTAKADDLQISQGRDGVTITRPAGLALSHIGDVNRSLIREQVQPSTIPAEPAPGFTRIFDFDRWMMGGIQALGQNQHILMAGMADKDQSGRVQDILSLAKMNIANDRGQEAVGFLNFAAMEMPEIEKSPEYLALRGAAEALAGKYELAWRDLSDPALQNYKELDYWRAYTLAWLEDWRQAGKVTPDDYSVLVSYPQPLLEKLGIKLAEIALRKNEVPNAQSILDALERNRPTLQPQTVAGMDYLKGQALHQSGQPEEETRKLWAPLVNGKDDFYRARAGLALTMMDLASGNKNLDQAIDRLEGLRYAWRGDELEAQINFTLGKLYLDKKEYMKGFNILRDAASMSPDSDVSREITSYMAQAFSDLLMNEQTLSPQDAVMVYEEFKELTPPGPEGNLLAQRLAERLVEADLLSRAGAILQHQVDFRIGGEEQARVATRLAAIYLLDHDPKPAFPVLDKAQAYYAAQTDEASKQQLHKIMLLRARALSQNNQTEEAVELLNTLPPDPDVNRLRADIAWQSGLWEDAAEALQDLIIDQALDKGRPLTEEQATLILNRAVALNLSGDRVELSNMLSRYGDAMKKTSRAEMFNVVTRPRKSTIIADKNTIEQIVSEVDMFKGFLDEYRKADETAAPAPAPNTAGTAPAATGTN